MSMNATDSACSARATFRATVDFPDPDPPATPMISGFISPPRTWAYATEIAWKPELRKAEALSQSSIGASPIASFLTMYRPSCVALAVLLAACAPPRPLPLIGSFDLVVAATTDIHGYARGWDYNTNTEDTARGLS